MKYFVVAFSLCDVCWVVSPEVCPALGRLKSARAPPPPAHRGGDGGGGGGGECGGGGAVHVIVAWSTCTNHVARIHAPIRSDQWYGCKTWTSCIESLLFVWQLLFMNSRSRTWSRSWWSPYANKGDHSIFCQDHYKSHTHYYSEDFFISCFNFPLEKVMM